MVLASFQHDEYQPFRMNPNKHWIQLLEDERVEYWKLLQGLMLLLVQKVEIMAEQVLKHVFEDQVLL